MQLRSSSERASGIMNAMEKAFVPSGVLEHERRRQNQTHGHRSTAITVNHRNMSETRVRLTTVTTKSCLGGGSHCFSSFLMIACMILKHKNWRNELSKFLHITLVVTLYEALRLRYYILRNVASTSFFFCQRDCRTCR